jgi:monoamine oxidase
LKRRDLLGGLAAASGLALAGCERGVDPIATDIPGGWVGADHARGHRLRELRSASAEAPTKRCAVAIVGGGVAGLAAARALSRAGIDDWRLFELEDRAGGNARGHTMGGLRCPLGAHYLPLPGAEAREVAELLHELGLARSELGRTVYDERHLAHAPQERVFVADPAGAPSDGRWHEGLLPLDDAGPQTLAALRGFAAELRGLQRESSFAMPTLRSTWSAGLAALDAQSFAAWLDAHGHADPVLRAYLDYCCRDDYGAGATMVSAWAGLHYFASRHGFHAPGDDDEDAGSDGVLTWPEGNAFLTERLVREAGDRIVPATLVTRIAPSRHEVELQTWSPADANVLRWVARQVIVCVPLFVAQRLIDPVPAALTDLVPRLAYAPWLVTNLQLREPLIERQGPPRAWDNVIAGSAALGYVDAGHQSLRTTPGPTVLTHYWALGGSSIAELQAQRLRLLREPWTVWRDAVLADLARAHPDLAAKTERIDAMRYGHAMLIPRPGLRGDGALAALALPAEPWGRLHFAHADVSGYSVFEEAYTRGTLAGREAARRV